MTPHERDRRRYLAIAEIIVVPFILGIDPVNYVFAEDVFGIGWAHFEGGTDGVEAGVAIYFVIFFGGLLYVAEIMLEGWYFEELIHALHFHFGIEAEGFVFDKEHLLVMALPDGFTEPLYCYAYGW